MSVNIATGIGWIESDANQWQQAILNLRAAKAARRVRDFGAAKVLHVTNLAAHNLWASGLLDGEVRAAPGTCM